MGQASEAVVFVRIDEPAAKLGDFWRLVDDAGFRSVPPEAIGTDPGSVYVVVEWTDEITDVIKQYLVQDRYIQDDVKLVWWALAIPPTSDSWEEYLFDADAFFDEVWVSDRRLMSFDEDLVFVLLGGSANLATRVKRIGWDVTFYHADHPTPGEQDVAVQLQHQGIRISPANATHRTKVMINAAEDGLLPLRTAMAATNHMALVTRPVGDLNPLVEGVDYVSGAVADLTLAVVRGHESQPKLALLAENLHELLVEECPFATNVVDAVTNLKTKGMN